MLRKKSDHEDNFNIRHSLDSSFRKSSSQSGILVAGESDSDLSPRKKSLGFLRRKSKDKEKEKEKEKEKDKDSIKKGRSRSTSIGSKSSKDSGDRDSLNDKKYSLDLDKKKHSLTGSIGRKFLKMKKDEDKTYINPLLELGQSEPTTALKDGGWEPPDSWRVIAPPEKELISSRPTNVVHSTDQDDDENFINGKGKWVPPSSWNTPNDLRDVTLDWNIRITKRDTTFATITCALDTTAAELCLVLGKKFFIKRDDSYQLYIKKNGFEWHLEPDEQPVLLQKKFLEELGYTEEDRLEQQGRKDNGYLFTFLYTDRPNSSDKPLPVLGESKNVNVAGLNLEALPVSVFKFASGIEHLSMNKNPRIDFPLDLAESVTSLVSLNLSDNEYNRAPRALSVIQTLQKLDLSKNHLDVIPTSFGKLINLIELDLRGNQLSVLPRELENLASKLTNLNLANNNFEVCPFVVFSLTNLKVLDLSFCRLTSIPQQLQNLENLTTLRLMGNQLTTLPTVISKLILSEIDVRENRIQDLTPLEGIQTLKKILAEGNSLSSYPIPVNHSSLTQVTLSRNSLTRFEVIPLFTLITVLTLSYNKLLSFPDVFSALHNLEQLDLDTNHISAIPPTIKQLKKLKTLSIANNDLGELPIEIGDLSKLELLDIHANNLKSLPSQIWKLGNLVVLNATSNLLDRFPDIPDLSLILPKNSPVPLTTSLFELYLADNSLGNFDIFGSICQLEELRVLNLSDNYLVEVPSSIGKLKNLLKAHFSGNMLTSLPDEIGDLRTLRHLYLNFNKLITLPAELSNLTQLTVIDVSHNNLKYNLANIQYEWAWNNNKELKILDLSANFKLHVSSTKAIEDDFFQLPKLQVLSLNELSPSIPISEKIEQQTRLRRYGTEDTLSNFGVAEFLGQEQVFPILDLIMLDFRNLENHSLYAVFDGKNGNSLSKYLQRWFAYKFSVELRADPDMKKALRRTFLSVNKDMGLSHVAEPEGEDVGCTAAMAYVYERNLVVANVGDTEIVSCNNGKAVVLTRKHDTFDKDEVYRVRQAGSWISGTQKLNNQLQYTRAFGHFSLLPGINASPYIDEMKLQDTDEFLIIASSSFWEVLNYQTAVDIARTEIAHPSRAAHRLRDYALSCGAPSAFCVLVVSLSKTTPSTSVPKQRPQRREAVDSSLARLEAEIEPPTGKLAIVFTDIKNSTLLWETNPVAMRAAIKVHNTIMRRCLRNIGGYEIKTEGDAFMVSFKNSEDALKWCFAIQLQLLDADWPQEILESPDGRETRGEDGQLLFKGLSVRIGIHLGQPVCEKDPITGRMDYFGPPVNRAARVAAVADGGQVVLSEDAWEEISSKTKIFESYDPLFFDMGVINLKGLGGEHIRMVLPGKLNGRSTYYTNLPSLKGLKADEIKQDRINRPPIDRDMLVQLSSVCARIEILANGQPNSLIQPPSGDAPFDEYLKTLEILVSRVENAISALWFAKLGSYTEKLQKLLSTGSGQTPHFSKKEDPASLLNALEYMLSQKMK